MPRMESLETRWVELFDELCRSHSIDSAQIAAPFFSVRAVEARAVLYVGKATNRDWYRDKFCSQSSNVSMKERREERHECTRNFLVENAPRYNSGFWYFAKELNTEAAKKWNQPIKTSFQHIAWTNICKIGASKGNPRGSLLKKQRDLALETLLLEIELYKPQLICFATWDYAFELVRKVADDPDDTSWDKTENKQWLWWREATAGLPPILLTGHPERKPIQDRERWLKKFWSLLPV